MSRFENFQKIFRNFSKFDASFKSSLIFREPNYLNLQCFYNFSQMAHIMHNREHKTQHKSVFGKTSTNKEAK